MKQIERDPKRKYNILVAEDDNVNFVFIELVLKSPLLCVTRAVNGLKAVEICHDHPEIDLILMDLKMPEMDGFEATRRIKRFRKELPVIAVTAFSGPENKKEAFDAGCDEFITKPVKKELLYETLKRFGLVFG
ncbi:MAG: response regulator [Bacteroidetes bacterium]|nr:response regulator [Bacteroidota bacterium]